MMSMQPRGLPVFKAPGAGYPVTARNETWAVVPEGCRDTFTAATSFVLPVFNEGAAASYFFDVFLTRDTALSYSVQNSAGWIRTSLAEGQLTATHAQQRIWVLVDWAAAPSGAKHTGTVKVVAGGKVYTLEVHAKRASGREQGFAATNGYVSIYAGHYQQHTPAGESRWALVKGLGATGAAVQALPLSAGKGAVDTTMQGKAVLGYNFYTDSTQPATVTVYTLPTFPLNGNYQMRYSVSVDDGKPQVVNFRTVGRSSEWKQAVLSNAIARTIKVPTLSAGQHVLKIYMIDPGVILDRITIDLGGLQPFYGVIPESKLYSAVK
jgi:hypothetical protein